jgi:CRP/FNR family transcriptional regulator, nitrogen fixation regulation protein
MYRASGGKRPALIGELSAVSGRLIVSDYSYRRGAEIFGEAEPAEYIYQIIDGAVRTHKLLPDGRRQIGAFHLSGDIFGLENGETHGFTAEAIVATTVRLVKRQSLSELAQDNPKTFNTILNMTTRNLLHVENHILLLGRKTALERVAAFLAEMHSRSAAAGSMRLPMTRRDIADYLGLTLETVSRALSELRRRSVIKFEGTTQRRIAVLDVQTLAKLAEEPGSGS